MIHCLVRRAYQETFQELLAHWAGPSRSRFRVRTWEELLAAPALDPGVWILSDLERLSTDERGWLAGWLARPEAAGVRRLNDPAHSLLRFDLLRELHAAGHNRYRVFRAGEVPADARQPVFVRREDRHDGPLTPLLTGATALAAALDQLRRDGHPEERLMVVEFCGTAIRGRYRKYSAMRIGPALLPRHVLVSRDWITKTPEIVDDEALRWEAEYLDAFPHREQLMAIFERACIDYGRIDYGLLDGAIQTWEINTNPVLVPAPHRLHPARVAMQAASARRVLRALLALDGG